MTEDKNTQDTSLKNDYSRNIKKTYKDVYYSDIVGDHIKDAITGALQPWRVGTKDEEKFFRVIVTTQPPDSHRKGKFDSTISRGTHKAFYDSPNAYMKHNSCLLDEEYIELWYEKQKNDYPEEFSN